MDIIKSYVSRTSLRRLQNSKALTKATHNANKVRNIPTRDITETNNARQRTKKPLVPAWKSRMEKKIDYTRKEINT